MNTSNLTWVTTFDDAVAAKGYDEALMPILLEVGKIISYASGDTVFEQATPRQWFGAILEGSAELLEGRHGDPRRVGTLEAGAMLSEGFLLNPIGDHHATARSIAATKILQLDAGAIEKLKSDHLDVYNTLIHRVAMRLSERLHFMNMQLAGHGEAFTIGTTRLEHDSLGTREIPANAYYGVQTLRAIENFPISGTPLYKYGHFCSALAYVKKAAAQANCELGVLDKDKADAIITACDEIIDGKLRRHFVVDMIQGGAGTSTNMMANEIIANRGLELLGHKRGEYQYLHPNDHVNLSQSTNDAYPTSIKIAVLLTQLDALDALEALATSLDAKGDEFSDVLKMGRTENQDAVPMTLGQGFKAYAGMVRSARRALKFAATEFHIINMGATAIGTGLNSPVGYAELVTKRLAECSGLPLQLSPNLVEATQDSGAFASYSGAMKRCAIQISKICNDLRWLSSGPRTGLNEINLPPMQPGSSIMPGKVNPVVPEMVSQVCYQIIGFDAAIGMAAEASELELNMAEPIMAYDLLQGLTILANAAIVLTSRCIDGITANREICMNYVKNSIGIVTALNPILGYEKSSSVAKEALRTGGSVYDLVLEHGYLTKEELDEAMDPTKMTSPLMAGHMDKK